MPIRSTDQVQTQLIHFLNEETGPRGKPTMYFAYLLVTKLLEDKKGMGFGHRHTAASPECT